MTILHGEVADVDAIIVALAALGPEVQEAAAEAANIEARLELKITRHFVPWERGELSRSGRVEEVDIYNDQLTAGIAYGGPAGVGTNTEDVDYALIVHEDLSLKHLFGRKAKFVEDPVREELESGRAAERMGTYIRKRLGLE